MITAARTQVLLVMMITLTAVSGCSHLPRVKWPFARKATVIDLSEDAFAFTDFASGASRNYPQYWSGNTLVIDLSAISGSGAVRVQPKDPDRTWPMRLALKLVPGTVQAVEVVGSARVIVPVVAGAARELALSPDVYRARTPELIIRWGAAVGLAAPDPAVGAAVAPQSAPGS
ncbi:MAG: hypothetical protein R3E77_12905 [Steroidobacteraceae bacterium]